MNSNAWRLFPQARWALGIAGVAVMCAGCGGEPQAVTSKTSKYEVEGESNPAASEIAPTTAVPGAAPSAATTGNAAGDAGSLAGSAAGDAPARPSATPPQQVMTSPQPGASQRPASDEPQELLPYLEQLLAQQPSGTTREEALTRFQNTQAEIVQTADLILQSSTATSEQKSRAAEGKVQGLSYLVQLGRPQAKEELSVFLTQLTKDSSPELSRLGRRMTFAQNLDAYAEGQATDTGKLYQEFESLFNEEKKDPGLFMLGRQVAQLFMQTGKNDEAIQAMELVHNAFRNDGDETVADQARSMGEEIKLLKLDINSKLQAYLSDEPQSDKALFEAMDQLFIGDNLGATTMQIAMQIAQIVESKKLEDAEQIYANVKKSFASHSDPEIAKMASSAVESYEKRRTLIGQPFEVEGITVNGQPFDWAQYRGKIVLVDFWATWCGPCLREIPNIRKNYEQYRDQGFEVVGINLDDDMQAVERFFSVQKLPWTTIVSSDPNKMGFENPLAVQCGVEAIPFLVLVDREGKAIALNPRGEELGKKLAELFGSAAPAGDPAADAKEKAKTD